MKNTAKDKSKKILIILSLSFVFIFLLLTSELIYSFRNRPAIFGTFFVYLAKNDIKRGYLNKAIKNLDKAANLYLKQNKIEHSDKIKVTSINSNFEGIDPETSEEVADLLRNPLYNVKASNRSVISNIYYKIALVLYKKQAYPEAVNSFLSTSVFLDPTLSFLHVELANLYFANGDLEKGREILNYCLSFDQPRKHCQDYIDINVRSNSLRPVGDFEEIIDNYQSR